MTAEEKEELLDELRKEFLHSYIGKENKNCLKPTLGKWCKDENGQVYESKMRKAFQHDGIAEYQAWECIRRLTCKIMGVSYIRQIKDEDIANKVADKLCETVCELLYEVRDIKEDER